MGAAAAAANIRAEGVPRNHNVCDGDDCCQDVVRQLGVPKRWPPGVRFHPTDEELVLFYLKRKVCRRQIKPSMIGEVDVYKWEPWDLPEKSVVRKGEKQWFFFSPRDRKYPNGSRSNRATKHGYWKATGKDRSIYHKSKMAGNKKTLVYYRGRAPKGERTDWVMHEYTIDEFLLENFSNVQDSYALYKLFMKSGPGPKNGEQYGAPFREEDWEDDIAEDSYMDQNDGEDISSTNLTRSSDPVSYNEEFCATLPVSDVENLLMQLAYEPDIFQEQPNNSAYTSKVDVEPEIRSNIIDPSFLDTDSILIGGETWFENGMERRFQNLQTVVAYSQPTELPDIVSEQHIVTADEEFLELKDLNDPDVSCSLDDIGNRILTFEPEEFYDPYDYFDANMYLLESMGLQYDEEPHNHAVPLSNELWTHEETFNSSTVPDTNEVLAIPPESGFDNPSHFLSTTQMRANEDTNTAESPSQSWFNSALSAFLDSVPSSPAFASEKVLISKAFERVSSFRTAQIRPRQRDAAASGAQRNRGYLFISVLVGFGAVLWVLTIGAAFKLLKGFWGRFLSA